MVITSKIMMIDHPFLNKIISLISPPQIGHSDTHYVKQEHRTGQERLINNIRRRRQDSGHNKDPDNSIPEGTEHEPVVPDAQTYQKKCKNRQLKRDAKR